MAQFKILPTKSKLQWCTTSNLTHEQLFYVFGKIKQVLTRVWRNWSPHVLLGAQSLWKTIVGKYWRVVPPIIKNRVCDLTIPLLGVYSKWLKAETQQIFVHPFTATWFTITKWWKQPKYPLREKWINKMCWVHITEYYSDWKRKEIKTHAMTWMSLDDILLNEISSHRRTVLSEASYMSCQKESIEQKQEIRR